MPTFEIAYINQQGTDLIIVPVESSFGSRTTEDRQAIIAELQAHAVDAALFGTVVPVWDAGAGRMAFIAPKPWHRFFKSISLPWVMSHLNRTLQW